jgi:predicted RNase H-like HicB family nuclease
MRALGDTVMTSRQGYVVVLERGPTSWGAFVPRLPGCMAVAATRAQAARAIEEAITRHLAGVRREARPRARGTGVPTLIWGSSMATSWKVRTVGPH